MSHPVGKLTYRCPHCDQKLSFLDGTLVKLVGRLQGSHFSCKTMFYIPAGLGQYGAIIGEGVRVEEGAKVDFECVNGACKRSLNASYDDNLAELKMFDGEGNEFVVVFNRTYGRRSTFIVDMKSTAVVESYGEHANDYFLTFEKKVNFFGA